MGGKSQRPGEGADTLTSLLPAAAEKIRRRTGRYREAREGGERLCPRETSFNASKAFFASGCTQRSKRPACGRRMAPVRASNLPPGPAAASSSGPGPIPPARPSRSKYAAQATHRVAPTLRCRTDHSRPGGGRSDLPLSYTALVLLTTVGGCKAATGSGTPPWTWTWTWRWLTPPGGHGGALYPSMDRLMVPPTSASLVTLPRPPPAGLPRTPPMAAWACRLAVPRGPAGRRRTGAPAPAPP